MKPQPARSQQPLWLIPSAFLLLYLIFPSHNSSIDAIAYASDMKYGEELFVPHHLLYNVTGYFYLQVMQFQGIAADALAAMKVFNAVAAFFCLLVFGYILREIKKSPAEIGAIVMIAGAAFGFWRFAVENETYIIPVLFSLLSAWFFIKYFHQNKIKDIWMAGLWGAVACLFHQIHFFWWLGMFAGLFFFDRKIKTLLYYFVPALLVPLAYALVIVFYHGISLNPDSFIHYIFSDYFTGKVVTHIGRENFVMEIISLLRTFFQVHGNIALILAKFSDWQKALALGFFLAMFLLVIKTCIGGLGKKASGEVFIIRTFILIFLLQYIFAFFSIGNAEFMVMLPFVLLIVLASCFELKPGFLYATGIFMLTWNFVFAIFPGNRYDYSVTEKYIDMLSKNPGNLYILSNKGEIETLMYYEKKYRPANLYDPPSYLQTREKGIRGLEEKMKEYFASGKKVYTNCINPPGVLSRKSYLEKSDLNKSFFSHYKTLPVDTIAGFEGNYYLVEVFN